VIDKNIQLHQEPIEFKLRPPEWSIARHQFCHEWSSVSRKDTTSMITIDFFKWWILKLYWADGLIISTPTGSTGYKLWWSNFTPDVKSLVITPIAPHNLNADHL
jgi:NAD+ kinase